MNSKKFAGMIALCMLAFVIPGSSAVCLGTTCAGASIDYGCEDENTCAFEANGSHEGAGAVEGVLTVKGSAIPTEELRAICSGALSCNTAISGEAVPAGCAIATAETHSTIYSSSDADYDCDDELDVIILDILDKLNL